MPQTHVAKNEIIFTTRGPKAGDQVEINPMGGLPERRIYLWFDVQTSAANMFKVELEVQLFKEGNLVGVLPADVGNNFAFPQPKTLASLVNAGGTPVGDCMLLQLAVKLNAGINQAVCQPFRINADINRLRLVVNKVEDPTGVLTQFHAFLGCVSTLV